MSKYILFFLRSNFKLLYFHLTPTFILTVCNKLQKEIKKKAFKRLVHCDFYGTLAELGRDLMLTFLRVLSLQRSKMSSVLGRGGITGASFFSSLSELEPDCSAMLPVGYK